MLIDLKPGETLNIGHVRVRVVKKSGQLARLEILAPESVRVQRHQPGAQECASTQKEKACGQHPL